MTCDERALRHSAKIFCCLSKHDCPAERGNAARYQSQRWNALSSTRWQSECGFAAEYLRLRRCFYHRLPEKPIHPSLTTEPILMPAVELIRPPGVGRFPHPNAQLEDEIPVWVFRVNYLQPSRGHSRVSSNDSPVSSKLLRLARICGHPLDTASMNLEPSFSIS